MRLIKNPRKPRKLPQGWFALKLGDAVDYGTTSQVQPEEIPNDVQLCRFD
jgi:hypothetical protein